MKIKFLIFIIFLYLFLNFCNTSVYAFLPFQSHKKNLKKINNLILNNDLKTAKQELEKIMTDRREKTDVLILIGDIAFKENNFKKARLYYQKALKQIQNNNNNIQGNKRDKAVIFNKIANTYVDKKEKIEAINLLKQAILENAYNEETYLRLADIYQILDIKERAEDMYKEAYKINPNNETINFNLGLFCEERLDYENAIKYYENVLESNLSDYAISYKLATLYFKTDKIQKALDVLLNITILFQNYECNVLLGDVYYKQNLYDKAADEYKKAITLRQDNKYAYFSLYLSLLKLQNYAEAEKIKFKIYEIFENNDDFNSGINILKKLEQ